MSRNIVLKLVPKDIEFKIEFDDYSRIFNKLLNNLELCRITISSFKHVAFLESEEYAMLVCPACKVVINTNSWRENKKFRVWWEEEMSLANSECGINNTQITMPCCSHSMQLYDLEFRSAQRFAKSEICLEDEYLISDYRESKPEITALESKLGFETEVMETECSDGFSRFTQAQISCSLSPGVYSQQYHVDNIRSGFIPALFEFIKTDIVANLNETVDRWEISVSSSYDHERYMKPTSKAKNKYIVKLRFQGESGEHIVNLQMIYDRDKKKVVPEKESYLSQIESVSHEDKHNELMKNQDYREIMKRLGD